MTAVWLFPGQGSQYVGMGRDLAENYSAAADIFARADAALGVSLSSLIFEGEEETLTLTANAQPALLVTSLAALAALDSCAPKPTFMAGHSLGEYTALTAAGVFELEDAVRLVALRGQAMQRAVPEGQGAMAAILGLDIAVLEAVVEECGCFIANDNAPGQVVISGEVAAIIRAIDLAKAKGAKRALSLAVSAPFHCPLMKSAAREMESALAHVTMRSPKIPVVSNVSAEAERDPERIRTLLIDQVTGRVRWRETMAYVSVQGVTRAFEIGPGTVLTGLARRATTPLSCISLGTADVIATFLNA